MAQFSRRTILQMLSLSCILLPSIPSALASDHTISLSTLRKWYPAPDGWVPNNRVFPVVKYSMAPALLSDPDRITALLKPAGWVTQWRAPVYSYQHFHSTSHVLLTVMSGEGSMQIGGDHGEHVSLRPGDVYFLPAGTGQRLINGSDDLQVLAAYPEGQYWDICCSALSHTATKRLAEIPLPTANVGDFRRQRV